MLTLTHIVAQLITDGNLSFDRRLQVRAYTYMYVYTNLIMYMYH